MVAVIVYIHPAKNPRCTLSTKRNSPLPAPSDAMQAKKNQATSVFPTSTLEFRERNHATTFFTNSSIL